MATIQEIQKELADIKSSAEKILKDLKAKSTMSRQDIVAAQNAINSLMLMLQITSDEKQFREQMPNRVIPDYFALITKQIEELPSNDQDALYKQRDSLKIELSGMLQEIKTILEAAPSVTASSDTPPAKPPRNRSTVTKPVSNVSLSDAIEADQKNYETAFAKIVDDSDNTPSAEPIYKDIPLDTPTSYIPMGKRKRSEEDIEKERINELDKSLKKLIKETNEMLRKTLHSPIVTSTASKDNRLTISTEDDSAIYANLKKLIARTFGEKIHANVQDLFRITEILRTEKNNNPKSEAIYLLFNEFNDLYNEYIEHIKELDEVENRARIYKNDENSAQQESTQQESKQQQSENISSSFVVATVASKPKQEEHIHIGDQLNQDQLARDVEDSNDDDHFLTVRPLSQPKQQNRNTGKRLNQYMDIENDNEDNAPFLTGMVRIEPTPTQQSTQVPHQTQMNPAGKPQGKTQTKPLTQTQSQTSTPTRQQQQTRVPDQNRPGTDSSNRSPQQTQLQSPSLSDQDYEDYEDEEDEIIVEKEKPGFWSNLWNGFKGLFTSKAVAEEPADEDEDEDYSDTYDEIENNRLSEVDNETGSQHSAYFSTHDNPDSESDLDEEEGLEDDYQDAEYYAEEEGFDDESYSEVHSPQQVKPAFFPSGGKSPSNTGVGPGELGGTPTPSATAKPTKSVAPITNAFRNKASQGSLTAGGVSTRDLCDYLKKQSNCEVVVVDGHKNIRGAANANAELNTVKNVDYRGFYWNDKNKTMEVNFGGNTLQAKPTKEGDGTVFYADPNLKDDAVATLLRGSIISAINTAAEKKEPLDLALGKAAQAYVDKNKNFIAEVLADVPKEKLRLVTLDGKHLPPLKPKPNVIERRGPNHKAS